MGGMKAERVGARSRPGHSPAGSSRRGQRAAGELREAGRPSMSIACTELVAVADQSPEPAVCGARRPEPT